jgi:hypothetical protein
VSANLAKWKSHIIEFGLFLIFLVLFGKFVAGEIWHAIGPLFGP